MTKEEIIETLKTHYSRDVRKQLIKKLLEIEKSKDEMLIDKQYQIINQIFNYVLKESNWKMGKNSESWDNSPLEVMVEAFPKLTTTKWYQDQNISTKTNIAVQINNKKNNSTIFML